MKNTNIFIFAIGCSFIIISCNPDKKEWEKIKKSNDVESLVKFQKEFPESIYNDSAKYQVEKICFIQTCVIDSIKVYQDYIIKFPKSIYNDSVIIRINRIKERIIRMEFDRLVEKKNVVEIKEFIASHPDFQVNLG